MTQTLLAVARSWGPFPEDWLTLFTDPEKTYVMLEDSLKERFGLMKDLSGELGAWAKGSIFSHDIQIKWRPRFSQPHAVLISDIPLEALPSPFQASEDITITPLEQDDQVILWGEGEAKEDGSMIWFEERVPRLDLRYPLEPTEERDRLVLQYRTYRVEVPGLDKPGRLHRWCGVGRMQ